MGIFKDIFSSKKEGKENNLKKIRAEHKNYMYFQSELNFLDNLIPKLKEDNLILREKGEFRPFNDWALAMKYLRKVFLKYSSDQKVAMMKEDYLEALDYYIKGWDKGDATYSDMIIMVSLAVLLEVSDTSISELIDYVDKTENNANLKDWKPDYVLGYLLNFRNPSKSVPDSVLIPKMYQQLVNLTKLKKEEAEHEMKEYLESWYGLHKNDPWYNNHKRQSGYKGYWCWEAGAVVKVMGLDDSSFKNHPHYPYDMVHWQDSESV